MTIKAETGIAVVQKWEITWGYLLLNNQRYFIHRTALFGDWSGRKLYPLQYVEIFMSEITSKGLRCSSAKVLEYPMSTGTGLACLNCNHRLGKGMSKQHTVLRCPSCSKLLIVTNGVK